MVHCAPDPAGELPCNPSRTVTPLGEIAVRELRGCEGVLQKASVAVVASRGTGTRRGEVDVKKVRRGRGGTPLGSREVVGRSSSLDCRFRSVRAHLEGAARQREERRVLPGWLASALGEGRLLPSPLARTQAQRAPKLSLYTLPPRYAAKTGSPVTPPS